MTDNELMGEATTKVAPLPSTSPSTPSTPPEVILTEEQQKAVDLILAWSKQRTIKEFKLGGYAGTGKTTVVKHIIKALKQSGLHCVVMAFTGKAVNVLQRKGVKAATMHSSMYECDIEKDGTCHFYKRSALVDNPTVVIVDEASMVSTDLYRDLMSFSKLVLFVGDPGQLEPVGDNPNLMAQPDFVLSKIHRQAEFSPIVTLASHVRQGGAIIPGVKDGLIVRPKPMAKIDEAVTKDQIIVAKNKVRMDMNDAIRTFKGFTGKRLVLGEKLIVLKNNRNFGVFNGMILSLVEIKETTPAYWEVSVTDETNRPATLKIWREPFENPLIREKLGNPPRDSKGNQLVLADYGYVITCHKSQGSEWDKVVVFDQWMPPKVWDVKRWRYTAITRAAKELTIFI